VPQPFWSPSYKKPILYGASLGLSLFLLLFLSIKGIEPSPTSRLERATPISGLYAIDRARGRKNGWMTMIGGKDVSCAGSAFGGKSDCDKAYEGKLVDARRVVMPGIGGEVWVLSELRANSVLLYKRSDAQLIDTWKSSSMDFALFVSAWGALFAAMLVAVTQSSGRENRP
jgi:hypothetical protein